MARRILKWMVLLSPLLGCPHTWGKEGYVERLSYENYLRTHSDLPQCPLDTEEWFELCGDKTDSKLSCPESCPLGKELKKSPEHSGK